MKLFTIYPKKDDSTSWYRGHGVFGELVREGVSIENGSQISWCELVGKDAVFFQRPFLEQHKNVITRIIKQNHKPIIVDYDDLLVGIPEDNQFVRRYKTEKYEQMYEEILNLADGVILSTEYMKNYLQEQKILRHDRVKVINNGFNDYIFDYTYNFSNYNKTILWRGTSTHCVDLKEYETTIRKLASDHSDFTFLFIGYCPESLQKKSNISHIPATDVIAYMNSIKQLKPSILFTPLLDIPFNRAKSNIAKIEGTWAGAVSLSMEGFSEWTWNNNTEYYFKNGEDLYSKMTTLIRKVRDKDPSLETEYKFNYDYIKNNLMLSRLNRERKRYIEEVISGYTSNKNTSI